MDYTWQFLSSKHAHNSFRNMSNVCLIKILLQSAFRKISVRQHSRKSPSVGT